MGHKVHPKAFRLAVTKGWSGSWFARQNFSALLKEDVQLRDFLWKRLKDSLVDRIEIERSRQKLTVTVYAAKPGTIIGRAGAGIEELTKAIKKTFYRGRKVDLQINVKEVQQPSLSARIVGSQIASDLEKRMPFRRIMKMAIERVMKAGAQGVKITISGRLNGAEIARTETLAQGKIPLHNLRADINFASVTAFTIYGTIGIKVWINCGEVFENSGGEK
jgi:small subunit ribosomal protein S3